MASRRHLPTIDRPCRPRPTRRRSPNHCRSRLHSQSLRARDSVARAAGSLGKRSTARLDPKGHSRQTSLWNPHQRSPHRPIYAFPPDRPSPNRYCLAPLPNADILAPADRSAPTTRRETPRVWRDVARGLALFIVARLPRRGSFQFGLVESIGAAVKLACSILDRIGQQALQPRLARVVPSQTAGGVAAV